jgi:hypothetical protein
MKLFRAPVLSWVSSRELLQRAFCSSSEHVHVLLETLTRPCHWPLRP